MSQLRYISPDELLLDSFRLGKLIYESGFRPRRAISIWRGGTPVGLGVDAYFRSRGLFINHATIATTSYSGIGRQEELIVKNLEYLVQSICAEDSLLIIDDVYETGNTIREIVETLRRMARANTPRDIRVATIHHKPDRSAYNALPLFTLHKFPADVWIAYPHELADLVEPGDPNESQLKKKSEQIWSILNGPPPKDPEVIKVSGDHLYVSSDQLLTDAVRLGVKIAADSWRPNFLIALWPGGVLAGLPVHEVFKYFIGKGTISCALPDHISINTRATHRSYSHVILGLEYLAANINVTDNVLIIDTTFRDGRLVNEVVLRIREALRRNIDPERIRVASVYYNPHYDATWTVRPDINKPDYYLKEVDQEVIYPASIHKLPNARVALKSLNPQLWDIIHGS